MNAVSKISIAGLVFQVDDEALVVLEGYLNRLRRYYERQESGAEIMESIEERIADLLAEKIGGSEIVGKRSVEEVIEVLGVPDQATETSAKVDDEPSTFSDARKKLYRDPDHKVFGGLFAGVAYYLGVNRNIFRLLFLFFAAYAEIMFHEWFHTDAPIVWLFFVIAYFALCIVVPMAKSWGDKMAMKGEASDLSSIGQQKRGTYYSKQTNPRRATNDLFEQLGKGVVRFFGLLSTVFAVCLIVSMVFIFFFPEHLLWDVSWIDFLRMVSVPHVDWVVIVAFVGMLCVAASLLYAGVKALFELSNKWRIGLVLNLVIVACVVMLSFLCVPTMMQFADRDYSDKRDYKLSTISSDTLYLEQEIPQDFTLKLMKRSGDELFWDVRRKEVLLYPDVNLFVTKDSTTKASIHEVSRRYYNRRNEWVDPAENHEPTYELIGNRLIIKGRTISAINPWDRTVYDLDIYLPKGAKVVKIGKFILDVDLVDDYEYSEIQDQSGNDVLIEL